MTPNAIFKAAKHWAKRFRSRCRMLLLAVPRRVECNVCDWQGRRFLDDDWHRDVCCPKCGSSVRHRLLMAAHRHLDRFSMQMVYGGRRVLHVAPEVILGRHIRPLAAAYVTADYLHDDVDLQLDITDMRGVGDGSYDAVIACDVLEHVSDFRRALAEMHRVLVDGGVAVLTVPQQDGLAITREDPSLTADEDRRAAFGQHDHVRMFGDDFTAEVAPGLYRARRRCHVFRFFRGGSTKAGPRAFAPSARNQSAAGIFLRAGRGRRAFMREEASCMSVTRQSRPQPFRVAAIMTCHDRKSLTLRCLESLRVARKHAGEAVDVRVFLVDDGSSDGTADAVEERFPEVTIVSGNGSLYWCGGMRLAWSAAERAGENDAYLWLNDDVQLTPNCLVSLLETAARVRQETGRTGIVVGATRSECDSDTSYGEMGPDGVRPPGDTARPIECFNGNIVLVPADVFRELGNLSRAYTHGFGDIDYACRARRRGVPIWLAPGHLGACPANTVSRWERRDIPLLKRLVALHRPTGCPPWELAFLTLRHGGWWFPYTVARLYWRAIFPPDAVGTHPKQGAV